MLDPEAQQMMRPLGVSGTGLRTFDDEDLIKRSSTSVIAESRLNSSMHRTSRAPACFGHPRNPLRGLLCRHAALERVDRSLRVFGRGALASITTWSLLPDSIWRQLLRRLWVRIWILVVGDQPTASSCTVGFPIRRPFFIKRPDPSCIICIRRPCIMNHEGLCFAG